MPKPPIFAGMELTLTLDSHRTQVQDLASQLGVAPPLTGRLDCPSTLGIGSIVSTAFPDNLWLTLYDVTLYEETPFVTVNPIDSDVYCLFINLLKQEVSKVIAGQTVQIGPQSANGVFYYAPGCRIVQQTPPHTRQHFAVFTFTRATFQSLLPALTNQLPPDGQFWFMDLDLTMQTQLRGLADNPPSALIQYARTLSFLGYFFEKAGSRSSRTQGLLEPDINALFAARTYLLATLDRPVPIAEVAAWVGFSETKLKTLFPRLFGKSVHQYWQTTRMERAKELLASRRFSVAEAGHQVGYTNLTHFAVAFRRQAGMMPRDFLKTIKAQVYPPTDSAID